MKLIYFALSILALSVLSLTLRAQVSEETIKSNTLFQPSLKFLENPVPAENSEAKTAGEMKPYTETIPGSDIKFKMVPIPGGKFTMGGERDEEEMDFFEKTKEDIIVIGKDAPKFEVEIKPFWMEEHEVTWAEFRSFALAELRDKGIFGEIERDERMKMADAITAPTKPYEPDAISYSNINKDDYPASGMTQYMAAVYCKWLTIRTGRYYRLPTEAEWEYASRAGAKTPFYYGDDPEKLEDYAWYIDNTIDEPGYKKVMQKKPNKFGLYDMHGNVAEWVIGHYTGDSYEQMSKGKFPLMVIPAKGPLHSIARGGSCDHLPEECDSSIRIIHNNKWKEQDPQNPQSIWWVTEAPFVGFRVVRPLDPPETEEEFKLYDPDPEVWKQYYIDTNGKSS